MAMAPDLTKTPTLYLQNGITSANVKNGTKAGLADKHVSFTGYGIDSDEIIVFGESSFYDKPGTIKFVPTYPGSKNTSSLILCTRINGNKVKTGWFNLGFLSRQMNEADGKSVPVDDFRKEMIDLGNDMLRLEAIAGKAITMTGEVDGFSPRFNRTKDAAGKLSFEIVRDENGNRVFDERKFATIDFCDVPAEFNISILR